MEKKVECILVIFICVLILLNLYFYLKNNNNADEKIINKSPSKKAEKVKTIFERDLKTDIDKSYSVNSKSQASSYDGLYKKIFNINEIEKVNINIYDKNYTYLLENAEKKPYVLADSIIIDGNTIGYVGMKTKGNESLRKTKLDKYSFSINLGKYINKKDYGVNQNLYGLKKISLNNMSEDTTFLKDYLSYTLMSELGICTPYYSLVELYINSEYKGLYLLLESMEEELINRCYAKENGFFAKPEMFGGELVYLEKLNDLIDDNGNYNFEIKKYNDKKNVLWQYRGILEEKNSGEKITDDNPDLEKLDKELNLLFKWLKRMNELAEMSNDTDYEKEVEKIIDIDNLIKYFAALTFLTNEDSYLGAMAHNYGLYIDENMYMNIIPWDFNLSFGNLNTNANEMINHDINNPLFHVSIYERPLLKIIFNSEEYRNKYYKYIEDCTKIVMGGVVDERRYSKDNFINIIDKIDRQIIDIVDSNVDYYSIDSHNLGIETLKKLIRLRTKAVKNQLDGNYEKIETNLNISNLGRILK